MYLNAEKKALFITNGEYKLDILMKQTNIIDPEAIIVLQNYGTLISQNFDEIMREIIIAVYEENVEEIFVVASKKHQPKSKDIVDSLYENKEMRDKIQELDYLFKTCKPELSEDSVFEWLESSNSIVENVESNIDIIRHHPLLPPQVQVTELYIDL